MSRSGATSPVPIAQPDQPPVIEVNDFVIVRPLPPATEVRRGICRFAGKTDFAEGYYIGVELVGSIGRNSGAVGERTYFSCLPGQGVFVRPELVDRVRVQSSADLVPSQPLPPGFDLQLRADLEEANELIAKLNGDLAAKAELVLKAEQELEMCQEELLSALEENKALQTAVQLAGGNVQTAQQLITLQEDLVNERRAKNVLDQKFADAMERLEAFSGSSKLIDQLSDENAILQEKSDQWRRQIAALEKEKDDTLQVLSAQDEELLLQAAEADRLTTELQALQHRYAHDVRERDTTIVKLRHLVVDLEGRVDDASSAKAAAHSQLSSLRHLERESSAITSLINTRVSSTIFNLLRDSNQLCTFLEPGAADASSLGRLTTFSNLSSHAVAVQKGTFVVKYVVGQLMCSLSRITSTQETTMKLLMSQQPLVSALPLAERLFAIEFVISLHALQQQVGHILEQICRPNALQLLMHFLGRDEEKSANASFALCRAAHLFSESAEQFILRFAEQGRSALQFMATITPTILRSLREIHTVLVTDCGQVLVFEQVNCPVSTSAAQALNQTTRFGIAHFPLLSRSTHCGAIRLLRGELLRMEAILFGSDRHAEETEKEVTSERRQKLQLEDQIKGTLHMLGQLLTILGDPHAPPASAPADVIPHSSVLDSCWLFLAGGIFTFAQVVLSLSRVLQEAEDDVRRGLRQSLITSDLLDEVTQIVAAPLRLVNVTTRNERLKEIAAHSLQSEMDRAVLEEDQKVICVAPSLTLSLALDMSNSRHSEATGATAVGPHAQSMLYYFGKICPEESCSAILPPMSQPQDESSTDADGVSNTSLVELARLMVQNVQRSWSRNISATAASPASAALGSTGGQIVFELEDLGSVSARCATWEMLSERVTNAAGVVVSDVVDASTKMLTPGSIDQSAPTATSSDSSSAKTMMSDETHAACKDEIRKLEGKMWELRAQNDTLRDIRSQLVSVRQQQDAQTKLHTAEKEKLTHEYEEAYTKSRADLAKLQQEIRALRQKDLQKQLAPMSQHDRVELTGTIDSLRWKLWSLQAKQSIVVPPLVKQTSQQLADSLSTCGRGLDGLPCAKVLRFTSKDDCRRSRGILFSQILSSS